MHLADSLALAIGRVRGLATHPKYRLFLQGGGCVGESAKGMKLLTCSNV